MAQMMADDFVTIRVAAELVERLRDWSDPVQIKIERWGDHWELIARELRAASGSVGEHGPEMWVPPTDGVIERGS